ncbi:dual specificity protein phosphatase 12 isoform X2 [Neltuma alba]|uniref:dual specificity protein phosphatase 12 isoform X2 n=1 Tax=Neltuma alba TaxID=207710 RepID=UPI0010A2DC61|nr:dual specificity protein phosphatase 12-like isoform X2 [Prosopis alba]
MPYLVREKLFIGDISDAAAILQNGSDEITHILSVLTSASISFFSEWRSSLTIPAKEIKKVYVGGDHVGAPDDDLGDISRSPLSPANLLYSLEYAGKDLKLVRMAVPLRDTENENLLDYLDVCLNFIDRSRKDGSVLVHCFAGVSRSAAIITAYLMRSEHLSQEGKNYNSGARIDSSKLGADPGMPVSVASEVEGAPRARNNHSPTYRCKKCRRVVALKEHVVDHVPGEGDASSEWQKWRSDSLFNKCNEYECSSIFIEPLQWMKAVEEGASEGKLNCAHCDARLGNFNWFGIQCSCGSWISPAFQIHKCRVDASPI